MIDTNLLPVVENPDSWRQVGAHRVSRRTSADRMDGRRILLTPGATLRFGSLGFVYTGLAVTPEKFLQLNYLLIHSLKRISKPFSRLSSIFYP
jgi:hypothetical protein